MRVLVVDDHEVVRIGVSRLIEARGGWCVCGQAANGAEAVQKVRDLSPDLVILDILMSVMNGFEAAAEIRRIAPQTRIILLSIHEVPISAREVGADAFVSKSAVADELVRTIEGVMRSYSRGQSA